jgi:hypothetical protein
MFLGPDDVQPLLWNGFWLLSLGVFLSLLIFPAFRSHANPVAWLVWANLVAGAV